MSKTYIQISSGRGPAECCRVVAKVLELMVKECKQTGLQVEVIDRTEGELNRTLQSAIIAIEGNQINAFLQSMDIT